jgi:hypothetical protein
VTGFLDHIKARLRKPSADEERRSAQRFTTHLERRLVVNVSVLDASTKPDKSARPLVLGGYTRDVSETGLGIVVPDIRLGNFYITNPGRTLRIMLGLPGSPVEIHAVPARYIVLEEGGESKGYLIGMQIKEMNERDRHRYQAFLNTLK